MAQRGKPIVIWSDHGTNFVSAMKEIKELYSLLRKDETNGQITDFCFAQNIQWHFTPEHLISVAYGRLQLKVLRIIFDRLVIMSGSHVKSSPPF